MIASETTGGDVAMLSAETEAVLKEAAALLAALHRGRTLRQIVMVLFLVFVVGITVAFYRLGAKVYDKAYLDQLAEARPETPGPKRRDVQPGPPAGRGGRTPRRGRCCFQASVPRHPRISAGDAKREPGLLL